MVWHDHPVNVERSARGEPPINGLWLYGGARGWKFGDMAPARVCNDLTPAAASGDWAGWLDTLEKLDRDVLPDFSDSVSSLILSDATRLVTLIPDQRWFSRRLPRLFTRFFTRTPTWTTWWHPQP